MTEKAAIEGFCRKRGKMGKRGLRNKHKGSRDGLSTWTQTHSQIGNAEQGTQRP